MSTTTLGPAVSLALPPPTPPPYNLLTVAEELPSTLDGSGGFDPHWRAGAVIWPYPPELASGEDPCATGTFDQKDEAGEVTEDDLPRFGAFTVYQPIVCSTFGTRDFAELQRRANAALVAHEANALERQLARGEFKDDNPFLGDSNLTVLGGGAVSAKEGLELLEEAIGQTAQGGVIHATPDVVAAWSTLGDAIYRERERLYTLGGTPVVRGTGYIDLRPVGKAAPNADQAWVYASGPVAYRRSEEIHFGPEALSEALDRETNRIVYRGERDYLVVWDLALQAAVLVDRSI